MKSYLSTAFFFAREFLFIVLSRPDLTGGGDLPGHFSIKTTESHLHVKREQLVNIESPLDGLFSKDEI